jgi:hypothetical protein
MTINEFCKITGLTEAQATGKEKIGGYLDLRSGSRYIGKEQTFTQPTLF